MINAPRKAEKVILNRSDGKLVTKVKTNPKAIINSIINKDLIDLFRTKIRFILSCQSIMKLNIVDIKDDKPIVL
ncbi:hypothetical protein ATE49_04190 [Elizabethkingia miricola]|uniref:Uncharacterized protein n=1 Tax=Elizabethkingia miricola TaxID=172045 RepID=A0ABD4DJ98_ELIMR|nr:hypothetical protein ATB95_12845 [Elizabethkingia miricola]OBS12689.1 hypothetical protein ATE49_04190 [Elizabethkingia miricola]OPC72200.1 hypothetical protein BAZ13_05695 [Elizabethkingia miricola]